MSEYKREDKETALDNALVKAVVKHRLGDSLVF